MTTTKKATTKPAAKRTTRRTAKRPEQENRFDLHSRYKSVEELELEMSKLVDAIQYTMAVCDGLALPISVKQGIIQSIVDTYFQMASTREERMQDVKAIIELLGKSEGGKSDE